METGDAFTTPSTATVTILAGMERMKAQAPRAIVRSQLPQVLQPLPLSPLQRLLLAQLQVWILNFGIEKVREIFGEVVVFAPNIKT